MRDVAMIPKIIHQVWVGDKPFPEDDMRMAMTLKTANPDWEMVIHCDNPPLDGPWDRIEPIREPNCQHLVELLLRRSGVHAMAAWSDVYRIDVLLREGGLYLDTDVFAVKPLGTLFDRISLALPQEFGNRCVGNFMIAATPGHPALWRYYSDVYERCRKWMGAVKSWNPVGITGPVPTAEVLSRWPDCVIFPFEFFSPWSPEHQLKDRWWEIDWPHTTVCVHAFTSKWVDVTKKPAREDRDGMIPSMEIRGPKQRLGACVSC